MNRWSGSMANTQKPKSEIFERVAEEERRWNVRFFKGARFVAVSLFLVVRLDADQDASFSMPI